MKARIKNYLSVTKKEWNGLVILVILIALVLAAPYVYQLLHKDNTINFKDFDKAVALLNKGERSNPVAESKTLSDDKIANPVMFPFNPNGLSIAQWEQLGLSERQASIIKRYEAKGGTFGNELDVKKIYGITADDYKRLEPYISIPEGVAKAEKLAPGTTVELNTADSAKLTQLRGIGPSFAVRIVRYRVRLGGFQHMEQLKEIYGVDSAKYDELKSQLTIDPSHITKLPINTISVDQLGLFPYLDYKQRNAVIEYRNQHGKFNSIADMKNIAILDDRILRKIEPYLNFK